MIARVGGLLLLVLATSLGGGVIGYSLAKKATVDATPVSVPDGARCVRAGLRREFRYATA